MKVFVSGFCAVARSAWRLGSTPFSSRVLVSAMMLMNTSKLLVDELLYGRYVRQLVIIRVLEVNRQQARHADVRLDKRPSLECCPVDFLHERRRRGRRPEQQLVPRFDLHRVVYKDMGQLGDAWVRHRCSFMMVL